MTQTNIPPKEIVTYNKEIQTTLIEQHEREGRVVIITWVSFSRIALTLKEVNSLIFTSCSVNL